MKDLLSKEESLYDFLGVSENSSRKDILNAISRKMLVDVKRVTVARHNLLVPQQRLYYDLLFYNDRWFEGFYGGKFDYSCLSVDKRQALALSWEDYFAKHPYDGRAAHSLALLYYWWAKYEEDCCKEAISNLLDKGISVDGVSDKAELYKLWQEHNGDSSPVGEDLCLSCLPLGDIWSGLISWWIAFLNSADFWETYFSEREELFQEKLDRRNINDIKEYLKEKLYSQITDSLGYYQQRKIFHKSDEFLKYRFWYTAETNYIHLEDNPAGAQGIKGGPIFLKKNGLLKQEEDRLRSSFERDAFRGDGISGLTLRKLLYLSPYASLLILIEEKNFDEALLEIGKLSPIEKKDPIIRYLLGRIYLDKARVARGKDNYEEASSLFVTALNFSEGINLQEKIKEEIASLYINWAAAEKDDEGRIAILENGFLLVNDSDKLNRELSSCLNIAAVKIANEVINRINDVRNEYWRRVSENNRYLRVLNFPSGESKLNTFDQLGLFIEVCFNCEKPRYLYHGNWYTYRLNNKDIGMCETCHYEIQAANDNVPKPSRTDISKLLNAYFKFKLASEIDKINQQAKENLDSFTKSLKQYCSETGKEFSTLVKEKEKKVKDFLEKRVSATDLKHETLEKSRSQSFRFVDWFEAIIKELKKGNRLFKVVFSAAFLLPLLSGRLFLVLLVAAIGMWRALGERRRIRLLWCILALWFIGSVIHGDILYRLGFLGICVFLLYNVYKINKQVIDDFLKRVFLPSLPGKLKKNKRLWIGAILVISGLFFWPIFIVAIVYLANTHNKE